MAGKVMEAIYTQNGFVLESLSKTDFDNQRIAKGVSVKVAHKIGDADVVIPFMAQRPIPLIR